MASHSDTSIQIPSDGPRATNGANTTSDGASTSWAPDLSDRHSRLMVVDDSKDALIRDLFGRYDGVMLQVDRLFKQEVNDNQRANALEEERNHLQRLLGRDPFVIVIIDGSCLLFSEELLKGGEQGGLHAAQSLKDQVTQWIPSHIVSQPTEFNITIKVYADFKELRGLYEPWQYQDFIRGFNTISDFVDIGHGRTNGKIIENVKLFLHNCHCIQLLVGGDADLLKDYLDDVEAKSRISLLQDAASTKESPFQTIKISDVFRKNQPPFFRDVGSLSSRTGTNRRVIPGLPAFLPRGERKDSLASSNTSASNPVASWAQRALAAVPLPQTDSRPRTPALAPMPGVIRNQEGRRIDPRIDHDPDLLMPVKDMKLCNNHHLLPGGCKIRDCHYNHQYMPSPAELKALRQLLRGTPCINGNECDDPDCIYGHR